MSNNDFEYVMDGDQWYCRRPDFVNLQVSPCGFGYTQIEALEDLLRQEAVK